MEIQENLGAGMFRVQMRRTMLVIVHTNDDSEKP